MKAKRTAIDLCLIFAVAVALRLFYLFGMERVIDTADAIHYIGAAKDFAAGAFAQVDPRIPMLYPLMTALASFIVPDFELAASLVSFIASALLVIPVYLLSRRMHGPAAARIAGLAVALWPWLADYGSRVAPEALACALWFTGVYLLAQGLTHVTADGGRPTFGDRHTFGGWRVYAAALALFALHLTRAEGTVLLVSSIPAAFILCLGTRRNLLRLIPFVLTSALLLAANTAYLRWITGHATANSRAGDIVRDLDLFQVAATGLTTLCDKIPIMLGPVLLLFLGAGFFFGGREISRRDMKLEAFVLFFAAIQWLASLTVLSPEPRYVMSVIVALSLWSARGIVIVGDEAARLRMGRWLRYAPASALVALMATGTAAIVVAAHLDKRPQEPSEYKVAGIWMKDNLAPGLIFSRKPQVAYYAGMPSTGPDFTDTLEEALVRARNVGAKYFVVDERYTVPMVPSLKPLLDPKQAPAQLKFVKDFPQYPHSRIVIYELEKNSSTN